MNLTPPTGTITFLFSDIEGSTRLWEAHPQAMEAALRRHDAILREAFEAHGGYIFKTVGDAFYGAFQTPAQAVAAALQSQNMLADEPWSEEIGRLRVRMALHAGSADERDGDYFGPPLNRVARLLSAGHGGQVLLTAAAAELARDRLPSGVSLIDLGFHRLKDLPQPETVFQLTGDDLDSTFPPLRSQDSGRHHLPLQLTPLIGREAQVKEVAGLLHKPDVRLTTLTGVGGTGKTRLALQVASTLSDEYEQGVHFVDLSAISDPAGVAQAIANTLDLTASRQDDPHLLLTNYLAGRHLLLVLDNFEQIMASAPLISDLLLGAPRLQILVTSRELLRLSGEHEYPVPPLALPTSRSVTSPDDLLAYEAIALFVDRARSVRHDFRLDERNADAVVAICRRLDGLPLAIELAAARVRLFTPQALLNRLEARLKTLRGGQRDLPERQQTLRGAIDWSYDLLEPEEQKLFWRLAVFSGGFGLDTAEAICGPGLDLDVIDGVESLLNKSLLRRIESDSDSPRFTMLETIGEYARERLAESGESEDLRNRHAGYYFELAEGLRDKLRTHPQLEWYRLLHTDEGNFRAALAYLFDCADNARAIGMTAELSEYWLYSYQYNEARDWLDRALALLDRATAPNEQVALPLRIDILTAAGMMAGYRNAEAQGVALTEQALVLTDTLDDPLRRAWAQIWWAALVDEPDEALPLARQGLDTFKAIDYGPGISQSLNIAGEVLRSAGNLDEAEEYYREVIVVSARIGDFRRLAMQNTNLAILAFEGNDEAGMLQNARSGLPRAMDHHVEEVATLLIMLIARLAVNYGHDAIAADLLAAALAWYEDMSVTPQPKDMNVERRLEDETRRAIGEATYDAARHGGAVLDLRAAVAVALEEVERLEGELA